MIAGPDGWMLTPEGAAVHPGESVAVIADVHLGYEWARASGGDMVPAHSLSETLGRLETLLHRSVIRRLIVAGDLVESPRACLKTFADVRRLREWLQARRVEMTALRGNHDPAAHPPLPLTCTVAGWTIEHGHLPSCAARSISGHHHPILREGGVSAPCFLISPSQIVLPAFSRNAAGLNVLGVIPASWSESTDLRCVAGVGRTILDFGPLPALRSSVRPRV